MRALIAAAIVVAWLGGAARATPSSDLERARASFSHGDWQSAIPVLNTLLYPRLQLVRQSEVVEAYILLGASYFEVQRTQDAREQFEKALQLEPEQQLSARFSTGAIRLFEDTRLELRAKLEREAEKKKIAERLKAIEDYRKSLVVYETRPYYVNFVPFGAGQFQNKQRGKGIFFFASEVAAGGASAGIFLYLATKYGLVAKVPLADGPRVRTLQQLEIGAGILFLGLHAWGVVDSLLHYTPRAQTKGDDSLLPPDLRDPVPPSKKTSLLDRVRFGPVLLPGGAGLGLSLEN